MVQRCCVPHCSAKIGDIDIFGLKVRFHRIPQSPERFTLWQNRVSDNQRFHSVLSASSRVCSNHFLKEDYNTDKLPFGNKNPLKKDSFPSIFKWNSNPNSEVNPGVNVNSHRISSISVPIPNQSQQGNGASTSTASSRIEVGKTFQVNSNSSITSINNMNISVDSTLIDMKSESDISNQQSMLINNGNEMWSQLPPPTHAQNIPKQKNSELKEEIIKKNMIIEKLLKRISDLEEEERSMEIVINDLRTSNESYENQIRELNHRNELEKRKMWSNPADIPPPQKISKVFW